MAEHSHGNDKECPECGHDGFHNPALAVDALVKRGDTILLIQRGRDPWKGSWALPGGFVDHGEDPKDAAIRELAEETGLSGQMVGLVTVRGDPLRDPRKHVVSIVYEVQADGDDEPVGGDDADDARFWPIDLVLSGGVWVAGDHTDILRDWLS